MKEKRRRRKKVVLASTSELEQELFRVRFKKRYWKILRSTIYALVITAAFSVLVATLLLPVLQIYGSSMSPTLTEGDIVISIKKGDYESGDIVALYYSNKVLVKRIIASEFDIVDLDKEGNITVNNVKIEEPYLTEKAYGDATDVEFPCQVPENSYFVLGDQRKTSVDSRNTTIGCIPQDEIVGKIVFTIWPFEKIGVLK